MRVFINKITGVIVYTTTAITGGGLYKTVGSEITYMPLFIEKRNEWEEIFIDFDPKDLRVFKFIKEGYTFTIDFKTGEYKAPLSVFNMEERHATYPNAVILYYVHKNNQLLSASYLVTLCKKKEEFTIRSKDGVVMKEGAIGFMIYRNKVLMPVRVNETFKESEIYSDMVNAMIHLNEVRPQFSIDEIRNCISGGKDKIIENLSNLIKRAL